MRRFVTITRELLLLAVFLVPIPTVAFELFDGRLQANGFYETQFRAIARNWDAGDGWDLTQWQHILNLELEWEIAPDGLGPFDLVSSFARIEARYDCIWARGCRIFDSVNTYGDHPRRFPKRYSDGRSSGITGAVETGDRRLRHGIPVSQLGFHFKDVPQTRTATPAFLWHVPGVSTLFGVPGPDGVPGNADDPAFYVFERFVTPGKEYRFGLRRVKGAEDGSELQTLGPWSPRNTIDPIGTLADRANPFNPLDVHPIFGTPGSTAMPYRPAPAIAASASDPLGRDNEPRGLFVPNRAVSKLLADKEFDSFDQNFSQQELSWNRGASQQNEKELKEAFLDLELFDSRLWVRLGRQNIVWGKTELFRTTDQFNPQDLALSSLPSFEESRIALWAARGVWSFYSVGPLEDVRVEMAANFDQVEPNDLGRCGEPYTPFPVCNKSAGLFAHGIAGFGIAGEVRPPHPWQSWKGLEVGARLEFRWNRFSFAISDFYGYEDLPYLDPVFLYERNVDPRTGRPRIGGSRSGCDPDGLIDGDVSGCLNGGDEALRNHHANQQRFAVICGASIGFSDLDRSVCAQSIFNSTAPVFAFGPIAGILSWVLAGSDDSKELLSLFLTPGVTIPTVPLNRNPGQTGDGVFAPFSITPGNTLSDQQQALFGCGQFWGTSCDTSNPGAAGGVDLLNTDLSVLAMAWTGAPGTFGEWDTRDAGVAQPGTLGFEGGPAGRFVQDDQPFTLPGARSPWPTETDLDPAGWNAPEDGCVSASHPGCAGQGELQHPFTGDYFQSEVAAFSWNFQMLLVVLSGLGKPDGIACEPGSPDTAGCREIDEFVNNDTFRLDGCSFARPQLCSNVQALYAVAHTSRKTVRAGGNTRYGRMEFDWHVGGSGVLRYEKRNVLGFSMDFAEDRTKSAWSLEATWIEGVPYEDHDQRNGLTDVDLYNLTVSIDRPTFINFLNADRTFFINSQWFFQYISGYRDGFVRNGPFNVLTTLRVETGYFRDRLLPGFTVVYDFGSASGAFLPAIRYRFNESFSATMGVSLFFGRFEPIDPPTRQVGDPPFRGGQHADRDFTEQGISPIRDRDEVFLAIRKTF
ncbi:hypothetical protein KJ059_11920 [Myxococcota bacterium]|nr:hypothetical protein [Myxococcota bacterium]MCZ7617965.1 hypothetical protein [Myxococcota bacterium]